MIPAPTVAVRASAPAKVILFGEHGVNRHQPALAIAVDQRVDCCVAPRDDGRVSLTAGDHAAVVAFPDLIAFRAEVDDLLATEQFDRLRERTADDFFAPARYVLAYLLDRPDTPDPPGLDVTWRSDLPTGAGLGSGAAANAALAAAVAALLRQPTDPAAIAALAWQGDRIAHGGVASGLDSGACALGGLIRYTLADGPQPVPLSTHLPLVIGDTRVRADTADVNTRVRRSLQDNPARAHLFGEMGFLVAHATAVLAAGDLPALGHLMTLNHLLLAKLGVSSPELERLVDAALAAGALGAKLSGSGGGGIVVALAAPGREAAVAASIEAAGGRAIVAPSGAPGVRLEDEAISPSSVPETAAG